MKCIIRANRNTNTESKPQKPLIIFGYYNGLPCDPELFISVEDTLIYITKSSITGELNYTVDGDKNILVIHREAIDEYANNFFAARMTIEISFEDRIRIRQDDNSNTIQVLFSKTVGNTVYGFVLYNGMVLDIKAKKIGTEVTYGCNVLCDDYDRSEIEEHLKKCIAVLLDAT